MAKKRPLEAIEVSPGEPAILQPGGLHVMLMALKTPLIEGEKFPLNLTFERTGSIQVQVMVEAPSTGGSPGDGTTRHEGG